VSVVLPSGWQVAPRNLTPSLVDPREVLSVGTFTLRSRSTDTPAPEQALDDLGARDAFVTLQERGLDPSSTWPDFPPRPVHFEATGESSPPSEVCLDRPNLTCHWFGFTDSGRHFHVLVAFGHDAPAELRDQTWSLLDSLAIDPTVRPDWQASG
jgi:hypothetical protein